MIGVDLPALIVHWVPIAPTMPDYYLHTHTLVVD